MMWLTARSKIYLLIFFFQKPSCLKPGGSTKRVVTMEKAVLLFEVALGRMGGAGIAAASSGEALLGQRRKTVMCMQWARGGERLSLALPGMMVALCGRE